MPAYAVARIGDRGSHGGKIITGANNVLVNGVPIARAGDIYKCADSTHSRNIIVGIPANSSALGRQAARVGMKTACGATIITGSPNVVIGDNVIIGGVACGTESVPAEELQSPSSAVSNPALYHDNSDTPHDIEQYVQDVFKEYDYDIDEEFHIFEYANILTEGSGLLHPGASFSLVGKISMMSKTPPTLLVSCVGYTAIGNLASSVTFWAKARLEKKEALIEEKTLAPSPYGYIRPYPDTSHIIGETIFVLPEPIDATSLTLTLTGSYFADFNGAIHVSSLYIGGITNVQARKSFEIMVRQRNV